MKYTLIQTYPGYETLGTIHCSENKTPEWLGTNFYDAHPKYWKKVEEVDYEITEVKYVTEIRFLDKGYYRIFKDGIGFELDYLLKNGGTIHSVKRLSDGEVFTIGDEITVDGEEKSYEIIKLLKFKDCIQVNAKRVGGEIFYRLSSISKLPKKTPLFTTEDGVEIFDKKTSYYLVSNDFKVCFSSWFSQADLPFKTFSTKEKAEEYILLNKPCLCLNDLKTIWEGANFPIEVSVLFKRFKKLAKSKL